MAVPVFFRSSEGLWWLRAEARELVSLNFHALLVAAADSSCFLPCTLGHSTALQTKPESPGLLLPLARRAVSA